jgi:hypothetical protein
LLAGLPQSNMIFNVVFFVVLSSALIQGATIAPVARWLGLVEGNAPPRVVTLDEWVVAIGLLMWVFRSFIPAPETVGIGERHRVVRLLRWMKEITWALGFVFVLDLLTRAVLGLGLKAFLGLYKRA